jgi:hypothetical protein
MAETAKVFTFEGFAGDTQAYASVFIDPETDPLNEAGDRALKAQNDARKKQGFEELPILEVRVYLPWPKSGLHSFVNPDFAAAHKKAISEFVKKYAEKLTGFTYELDYDKLGLGQMRIDINRSLTTPLAYKLFTKAGVKLNPKAKKKAAKKQPDIGVTL